MAGAGAPEASRAPAGGGSGGLGGRSQPLHQPAERGDHLGVALAQRGREEVLADLFAAELVAAVTAGMATPASRRLRSRRSGSMTASAKLIAGSGRLMPPSCRPDPTSGSRPA